MHKTSVVCLVAREPGWRCLQVLSESNEFEILSILSHYRKPSSEDPDRGAREDWARFESFAKGRSIPFAFIDSYAEAKQLSAVKKIVEYDWLISCNWKYLIPEWAYKRARLGAVNLHRGKLPDYRGLEPVRRALEDGQKNIYLSAHKIDSEYDTGELIAEVSLSVTRKENETLRDQTERLKKELYPYYPKVLLKAMEKIKTEILS